jgi:hypothetical protein
MQSEQFILMHIRRRKEKQVKTVCMTFWVLVITLVVSSISAAGEIKGTIGVVLKSGDIKYGAKVDVYLTTKEILFQSVANESSYNDKFEYRIALINSYGAACEKIQSAMNEPDYIKQQTRTNLSCKFSFTDVKPGKYFLVVTFPTRIVMHMVLWQLPVIMKTKDIEVELSNDNMALPPLDEREK